MRGGRGGRGGRGRFGRGARGGSQDLIRDNLEVPIFVYFSERLLH